MARKKVHHPSAEDILLIPLPNGCCGAIWIILVESSTFTFLVLDGFWNASPEPAELADVSIMPSPFGAQNPHYENVFKGWFSKKPPKEFKVVGCRPLTRELERHTRPEGTMVFQSGRHVQDILYRQWRWLNDHDALVAEWNAAAREVQSRQDARTTNLTLERMLEERPFTDWKARWSDSALLDARRIFQSATSDLIGLGAAASEGQRLAILRRIVSDFNELYDREGCIETVEAHQIIERIEELARLVGLSNDDELITGQRLW
jgi:hypothetical protein